MYFNNFKIIKNIFYKSLIKMGGFSGGLIQLASKGQENMYLTDNPEITWFKIQYRRHTNFSIEEIQQNFIHPPNFGNKVFCNIGTKNGDLIHKMNLVVKLPEISQFYNSDQTIDKITKFRWCRKIGYALIKQIDVSIGGKLIDRQYGEWLNIWSELFGKKNYEIDKMIGNIKEIYDYSTSKKSYELYIPLRFWFCNYITNSLPILCLLHNDIKINLELNTLSSVCNIGPSHYILTENDCVNFIEGEYIEQYINGETITGQFMYFDDINKRLYYNRISNKLFQNINTYSITNSNLSNESKEEQINNLIDSYTIYGLTSGYQATPKINDNEEILTSYLHKYTPLTNINLKECYLLVEYIFLDVAERKRLYEQKHEFLIEQLLLANDSLINNQTTSILSLYHPVKYIVWTIQQEYLTQKYNNDHFNYTNSYKYYDILHINDKEHNGIKNNNTEYQNKFINNQIGESNVNNSILYLNDIKRIEQQDNLYYGIIQPLQHFNYIPQTGINIYSFSLNPCEFQPSGSCNMSLIDNIKLLNNVDKIINNNNPGHLKVYGVCYNILKIESGLGEVKFVN